MRAEHRWTWTNESGEHWSQVSGLLRSYRNSRTWGTGRQGRVLDEGRRSRMFRMGRQSGGAGGQTNLLTLPGCEGCEGGDARSGERKVREGAGSDLVVFGRSRVRD